MPVLRTTVWSGMTESFNRAALPGHFDPKPFRPGTPQPKSFVFLYAGSSGQTAFSGKPFRPGTPKPKSLVAFFLYGGSSGQTAFSCNKFDFGTSIDDKRTVSVYHNQTNVLHSRYTLKDCEGKLKGCQEVSKSKKLPGSITIKRMHAAITIQSTTKECHDQENCQGYHNIKDFHGVS